MNQKIRQMTDESKNKTNEKNRKIKQMSDE